MYGVHFFSHENLEAHKCYPCAASFGERCGGKGAAIMEEFPTTMWVHLESLCKEDLGKAHADVDVILKSLDSDPHFDEWWISEEGGGACRKDIDDAGQKAFVHALTFESLMNNSRMSSCNMMGRRGLCQRILT